MDWLLQVYAYLSTDDKLLKSGRDNGSRYDIHRSIGTSAWLNLVGFNSIRLFNGIGVRPSVCPVDR